MKGFINGSCCFSILKLVVLVSYEGELFLVPKCNNSLGVVESLLRKFLHLWVSTIWMIGISAALKCVLSASS